MFICLEFWKFLKNFHYGNFNILSFVNPFLLSKEKYWIQDKTWYFGRKINRADTSLCKFVYDILLFVRGYECVMDRTYISNYDSYIFLFLWICLKLPYNHSNSRNLLWIWSGDICFTNIIAIFYENGYICRLSRFDIIICNAWSL